MEQDKELKAMTDIVSALSGLESDAQARVLNYVLGRLGIRSSDGQLKQFSQAPGGEMLPLSVPAQIGVGDAGVLDIRTLKEQKNPRSALQMSVLVAYYLKELAPVAERKNIIDANDIERYFKQAGFVLPSGKAGAADTLNNAKKAGYLESFGTGNYKLNAVGYNLVVFRLNDQGSTNEKKKRAKSKKNVARKAAKKRR